MPNTVYDTIVIGAGHAGLSISYHLSKRNINHIVFERGRIGESWRSQRWDSFTINTPTWTNGLPGQVYDDNHPDEFYHKDRFIKSLDEYAEKFNLPVLENTNVDSLHLSSNGSGRFEFKTTKNGSSLTYFSNHAVIASGIMNVKKIPSFSSAVQPDILQLHAGEYRNPLQLPEGAVLVAGSGQSGCQIAEDLLKSGRKVYLASSRVGRTPRRYRGKDILYWLVETGFMDVEPENVTDPQMLLMKQPQISGVGKLGHTVSLQSLARAGAVILGKMEGAKGSMAYFRKNAAEHVMFADGFSNKIKEMVDSFIAAKGLNTPPPEHDEADIPDLNASCASDITELNLTDSGINSIIWSTGFGSDFGWIKFPVTDENGKPKHTNGIGEVDGLYFLGFPWLRKRKSGIILGIAEDAGYIADMIANGK